MAEAADRAAAEAAQARAERDEARTLLTLEQMRSADLRERIEALQAEAAALRERAVTAELRAAAGERSPDSR
ncbi:hypothetical protein [Streptosporangium sandarakinum]|uniref:hypothetical protein n=1 Tax=Streptosporangium sandarakinum TaxID=1260955 RepID=UPI00341E8F20